MIEMSGKILVTGATGFVGGRLLHALTARGLKVRSLVRSPEKLREGLLPEEEVEIVKGDLLKAETLDRVLEGIEVAYYMVHSMGGRTIGENKVFAERDRSAAGNFVQAADRAGLQRIIYLGGLGETGDKLSKHLASRQEVGEILSSGRAQTTILRAPNIMGAGGAPFEMLRFLVERLPVMVCPRWIETRAQPIDIRDMVDYLLGCLREPATGGLSLDVGGPEILTYRDMMEIYSRVRGLKRIIITVPVLTPRLSTYWVNLVTPVPSGIVNPLVEGLRNEVICRENRIRELIPIKLTSFEQSICNALQEIEKGPGKLISRQSCFLPKS
ncbi:MAG: NAD(P)H-binding protein [Deltaproteobacteria bacterium]|nr:MAG: NAD(P)H-binding protein [Deltaproteobacteria bacterium]